MRWLWPLVHGAKMATEAKMRWWMVAALIGAGCVKAPPPPPPVSQHWVIYHQSYVYYMFSIATETHQVGDYTFSTTTTHTSTETVMEEGSHRTSHSSASCRAGTSVADCAIWGEH